jgi:hypothetical protein
MTVLLCIVAALVLIAVGLVVQDVMLAFRGDSDTFTEDFMTWARRRRARRMLRGVRLHVAGVTINGERKL